MERARLGAAVVVAAALPGLFVLWCHEAPGPIAVPAPAPPAAPAAPPASPAPAAPVDPLPMATPAIRPAAPTVTIPCMDAKATLFASDISLVVCWPDGACLHEGESPTQRPADPPSPAAGRVEPARVCTGARCDALGPRLRAEIATAGGGELRATTDHAIVVVGSVPWNRTADRPIGLPRPIAHGWDREGSVTGVAMLGRRVLVVRSWDPDVQPPPPRTPNRGRIIDADGQVTATIAVDLHVGSSTIAVGDDAFVVFNGAGGFSLIVAGRATWFGDLVQWQAMAAGGGSPGDPALQRIDTVETPVQVVTLSEDSEEKTYEIDGSESGTRRIANLGTLWCGDRSCQLARLQIGFADRHGKRSQWLHRSDERAFPRCW